MHMSFIENQYNEKLEKTDRLLTCTIESRYNIGKHTSANTTVVLLVFFTEIL